MSNSHKSVVQADAHAPATHAATHNAGGTDAMTNPQFTTIELGHASDTTLTRVSSGVVAIEGTNIVKAGVATGSGITMATARLLGRTTASTGAIEEISVGTGLSLSAGSLTATGSSAGTVLAVHNYAPAQTVYSVTSGTMADVDATNMVVTFTAPASGNVIITLSAYQDHSTNGANNAIWDLRESTTNLNVGGIINRNALQEGAYTTVTFYVTGISAGSHTYKWAFALTTGGSGTARIIVGPGSGGTGQFPPAIMVVTAAP